MAAKKTGTKNIATETPKTKGKVIVLKELCKELKIEPKAARRVLRKAGMTFHGKKERWTFNPAQAKQAREALTG